MVKIDNLEYGTEMPYNGTERLVTFFMILLEDISIKTIIKIPYDLSYTIYTSTNNKRESDTQDGR